MSTNLCGVDVISRDPIVHGDLSGNARKRF